MVRGKPSRVFLETTVILESLYYDSKFKRVTASWPVRDSSCYVFGEIGHTYVYDLSFVLRILRESRSVDEAWDRLGRARGRRLARVFKLLRKVSKLEIARDVDALITFVCQSMLRCKSRLRRLVSGRVYDGTGCTSASMTDIADPDTPLSRCTKDSPRQCAIGELIGVHSNSIGRLVALLEDSNETLGNNLRRAIPDDVQGLACRKLGDFSSFSRCPPILPS